VNMVKWKKAPVKNYFNIFSAHDSIAAGLVNIIPEPQAGFMFPVELVERLSIERRRKIAVRNLNRAKVALSRVVI